jgi:hypothetical protein
MPINNRQSERTEDSAVEDRPRVLFKAVSVFDRSQVAPLDGVERASLEPPC